MRLIIAFVLLGFLLGCGGGASHTLEPEAAGDFALSILQETAAHGTSECTWDIVVEPTADGYIVNITASGAQAQKALYFDLVYDAAALHPVAAGPVTSWLDCAPLSIAVLDDRGTVHYGQILPTPAERVGFNGDGVVATVEFKRGAAMASRRVNNVPTHTESSTVLEDTYPTTLRWTAKNIGDCNQDGLVNATDLTPIGQNFNPELWMTYNWFPHTAMQAVDTDSNGLITAADITAIGRNFGNSILGGYRIYGSPDPADYPSPGSTANGTGATLFREVEFADAADTDLTRYLREYSYTLPSTFLDTFYWVRPVDLDGNEGTASSMLTQVGLDAPRGDEYATEIHFAGAMPELELRWTYRYPGDYNQDFLVNDRDLAPIGQHMGRTAPFDEYPVCAVIDGNRDDVINLNDAWYILDLFGTYNPSYAVFASTDPADYPAFNDSVRTLASIDTVTCIDAGQEYNYQIELVYQIEDPQPGMYYWVRLVDENGYCGTPSNMVGGV